MSRNDNLGGSIPGMIVADTTRTAEMEAYDKLPFSVRAAIDDFPVTISVPDVLQCFDEVGERQTIEAIKFNKRIFLEKLENEKMSLLPKEDQQTKGNQGS